MRFSMMLVAAMVTGCVGSTPDSFYAIDEVVEDGCELGDVEGGELYLSTAPTDGTSAFLHAYFLREQGNPAAKSYCDVPGEDGAFKCSREWEDAVAHRFLGTWNAETDALDLVYRESERAEVGFDTLCETSMRASWTVSSRSLEDAALLASLPLLAAGAAE